MGKIQNTSRFWIYEPKQNGFLCNLKIGSHYERAVIPVAIKLKYAPPKGLLKWPEIEPSEVDGQWQIVEGGKKGILWLGGICCRNMWGDINKGKTTATVLSVLSLVAGNRFQLEMAVWFVPETKLVIAVHSEKQTRYRYFVWGENNNVVEGN